MTTHKEAKSRNAYRCIYLHDMILLHDTMPSPQDLMMPSNLGGDQIFDKSLNKPSRQTRSMAMVRSMKATYTYYIATTKANK